ncbi:hypothetical protein DFH94DRAFT_682214 [Russula ochroleuca]|uniref:Uncharacterized protein n=1 Tax=Russula ochroleuca TaxID=152965 RepID=A0A9P5MWL7_9AGAM|nr:hypothetical protein DFH94DRAFT_682214 [Russula ochroleuca]
MTVLAAACFIVAITVQVNTCRLLGRLRDVIMLPCMFQKLKFDTLTIRGHRTSSVALDKIFAWPVAEATGAAHASPAAATKLVTSPGSSVLIAPASGGHPSKPHLQVQSVTAIILHPEARRWHEIPTQRDFLIIPWCIFVRQFVSTLDGITIMTEIHQRPQSRGFGVMCFDFSRVDTSQPLTSPYPASFTRLAVVSDLSAERQQPSPSQWRLDATARVLELKEENSSAMGAYKSDSSVTMHSLAFLGSHSRWQALQAPLRITTQLYPPIESISSPSEQAIKYIMYHWDTNQPLSQDTYDSTQIDRTFAIRPLAA